MDQTREPLLHDAVASANDHATATPCCLSHAAVPARPICADMMPAVGRSIRSGARARRGYGAPRRRLLGAYLVL